MTADLKHLLSTLFKSHPWHGVDVGDNAPELVKAFIEIVPGDAVKLELDKATGHLHVDRPQLFSSLCPTLYGFIPKTYCGKRVAKLASRNTARKGITGDLDPLDICVLTEKTFTHGDLFVNARVIGGLRMIDRSEADDKIIAVLENDVTYGHARDLTDLPQGVVQRLSHYFLSYKRPPGMTDGDTVVQIDQVYGREAAYEVIAQSMSDYDEKFGSEDERLAALGAALLNAAAKSKKAPKKTPAKRK
ncbi:MAG: inorganic pyrophosphatase [Cyanobacteria bacterium SZAS LIN-3]|nr:inorganic pyrophosphatase [Cyanobacteria bacterium SZAS LIN-3]